MNENIKPIELERNDFIEAVVKLVNETNLPAFVMADALKGIYDEVNKLAARQYEEAKAAYEEKEKVKP